MTTFFSVYFQWYEDYGDPKWKSAIDAHIRDPNEFKAYSVRTLNQFVHVVGWLREWACSRNYGLGTSLPWDKQVLIESLSDSTIYMAYYAVAHLLQGCLNGDSPGELGLTPDQMTDEVFDFIFMQTDRFPEGAKIERAKLNVGGNRAAIVMLLANGSDLF